MQLIAKSYSPGSSHTYDAIFHIALVYTCAELIFKHLLGPDRTTQGIFTVQAASFGEGIVSSFEPASDLRET